MRITIKPKDKKLLKNKKVREYYKHVEKEVLKSLDAYAALEKIQEAIALGVPYSYEFNEETRMIDVVLHKDMINGI